ncbi:MAG: hypothetical protein M3443_18630 [Actinomycetota bacterium]|nr:hypothetical protein [Actinomycetota bacterium]
MPNRYTMIARREHAAKIRAAEQRADAAAHARYSEDARAWMRAHVELRHAYSVAAYQWPASSITHIAMRRSADALLRVCLDRDLELFDEVMAEMAAERERVAATAVTG